MIKFHLHKQCTSQKTLRISYYIACIRSLEPNFSPPTPISLPQILNKEHIINTVVTDPTYIIAKCFRIPLGFFFLGHGSKNAWVQLVSWLWACLSVLSGILQQRLFHFVPGSTRRTKCNSNLSLYRKNVFKMNIEVFFSNVLQFIRCFNKLFFTWKLVITFLIWWFGFILFILSWQLLWLNADIL